MRIKWVFPQGPDTRNNKNSLNDLKNLFMIIK